MARNDELKKAIARVAFSRFEALSEHLDPELLQGREPTIHELTPLEIQIRVPQPNGMSRYFVVKVREQI